MPHDFRAWTGATLGLGILALAACGQPNGPANSRRAPAQSGHVGDHVHSHDEAGAENSAPPTPQPPFDEQAAAVARGERDAIELDRATDITDERLDRLRGLENLRGLRLLGAPLTDAAIDRLAGLKNLERINLDSPRLGDAAAAALGKLASLQQVRLANAQITDAGLKELAKLTALRYLILDGTQIGDAGLQSLSQCQKLESLYVEGTPVTADGVERLRKSLGGLHVHY